MFYSNVQLTLLLELELLLPYSGKLYFSEISDDEGDSANPTNLTAIQVKLMQIQGIAP